MNKFIAFTFLVLGVGFYELSGGSDFVLETRESAEPQVARAQPLETVAPALPEPAAEPVTVATIAPREETPNVQLASFNVNIRDAELPKIDLSKFEAPAPSAPVQAVAEPDFVGTDIRQVTGNRVNVRSGPGTGFEVVAQAIRGDEAEVIIDDGTGWVQLRLAGGQTGWMADFLLSD
ncbi:SH3 domain-containing protein [Cognatishimia sp. MH4019]|uniref:SH3 domain-containing protein n=1 Tax=Cognatishimia sp. MH4019 TaxID=2854030 RepID=UPI001CD35854|nr:SH3 domain-containing protein [Cognatishimia sp. MH4019]